jgi:hypothetical protein
MAISQVEIVNMGLSHIGVKAITSMTESSEPARRASLVYEICRDAVLRAAFWNFATKIEALAEISGESVPGWTYLYAYPSRALFIRKLFDDTGSTNPTACEFKEVLTPTTNVKALASNVSPAYVEYTKQEVDPTLYDTAFIESFSYKLAAVLAQPLTGNKELGLTMLNTFNSLISDARRVNASEGYVAPVRTSSYINAR